MPWRGCAKAACMPVGSSLREVQRLYFANSRVRIRDLPSIPAYRSSHVRGFSPARVHDKNIIEGINYAAYRETDSSLHDADKNRLFGSEHYKSNRPIVKPSLWAEGDFEEKMSSLLRWANILNRSVPAFKEAQTLLEGEDSVIGQTIRRSKRPD
jgi:hypothetical protein